MYCFMGVSLVVRSDSDVVPLTLSTNAAAPDRQRGDSRSRLRLAALAQELPELADRLVLVRPEILLHDELRAGPVGPGVLDAFFQHEQRVMRDLDVVLHRSPRRACGHQADRGRVAVVVRQIIEHWPSPEPQGWCRHDKPLGVRRASAAGLAGSHPLRYTGHRTSITGTGRQ